MRRRRTLPVEVNIRTKSIVALSGLLLAMTTVPVWAAPEPVATNETVVATESGTVAGITTPSGGSAFLGIPFAAPPVRELRWRDPQPAPSWTGTLHADRFGPQCTQPQRRWMTNQYSGAEVTSEDCLYLNVWNKPGLKKAPVIVYIYGGGFFIGAANMPLYGGEQVSQEGAVFVNFNYRVGPLGFMAHPALTAESSHNASGNYGFLDQIAALKWVQRNIARFGGDPDNVTIVGQSAGSMSVLALQASPLTKGLFHRAVGMSGAQIGGSNPMLGLAEAEADGVKLQKILKADSIAQLRNMPADLIVVPRVAGSPRIGPIQDGYVLPQPVDKIFAQGEQNDVPLILGFTRDESFGGFGEINGLKDYQIKAKARFGDSAADFLKLYPAATDAEARAQARLADRDSTMALGMKEWAVAQKSTGKKSIFTYEFSRSHSYAPDAVITDLDTATAGAYHTSEVPFWLGSLESFNRFRKTREWTAEDRAFSHAMTQSLVAFARVGDPNTSALKWPQFNPAKPTLLQLGANVGVSQWPDSKKLDFFRAQLRPVARGGAVRD